MLERKKYISENVYWFLLGGIAFNYIIYEEQRKKPINGNKKIILMLGDRK